MTPRHGPLLSSSRARQLKIDENAWKSRVIEYAQWRKWLVTHIPVSTRGDRHYTAYEGDDGLPDLILLHPLHGPALAELKTDLGLLDASQLKWVAAGAQLWRPRDWDELVKPFLDYGPPQGTR